MTMKMNVVSALVGSSLTLSAWTDYATAQSTETSAHLPFWTSPEQVARIGALERTSRVIGWEIRNHQDEKLGKIDDLAIALPSGRVVEVIMGSGGFLGIGEKHYAIPPGALKFNQGEKFAVLNLDEERLKSAPQFQLGEWRVYTKPGQIAEVYRFYGQESLLAPMERYSDWQASESPRSAVNRADKARWNIAETDRNLGEILRATRMVNLPVRNSFLENIGEVENMMMDLAHGRLVAVLISTGDFLGLNDTLSAVPPQALQANPARDALLFDVRKDELANYPHFNESQWPTFSDPAYVASLYQAYQVRPYFDISGIAPTPSAVGGTRTPSTTSVTEGSSNTENRTVEPLNPRSFETAKADKLIGMTVRNQQREKVGQVENVIMDLTRGRIVAVVVSSGGFLGIGDILSAVPPEAFQTDPVQNALVLDVTKESLANYPQFKSSQWPDFNDPAYINSLYEAYRVRVK